MGKLLFYRQKRVDDGMRTGLELGDVTLAEQFEPGPGERDPILRWYVDVKCEGPAIPDDPDRAEEWFIDRGEVLRKGLTDYAKALENGVDAGFHSITWNSFSQTKENVYVTISCSASDRSTARRLPSILTDMASRWDAIMDSLELVDRARN
jgi:hypothetical protein